jgi:hypothetical protein
MVCGMIASLVAVDNGLFYRLFVPEIYPLAVLVLYSNHRGAPSVDLPS